MLISTDAISPDLYKKVRRSVGDFFLVILWRWPNIWLHRPGTDVIVCASEPELTFHLQSNLGLKCGFFVSKFWLHESRLVGDASKNLYGVMTDSVVIPRHR